MRYLNFDEKNVLCGRYRDIEYKSIPDTAVGVSDAIYQQTINETDGIWKIDRETGEIEKHPFPEVTMDEAKSGKLGEISAAGDAIPNTSIVNYPSSEIQTFSQQIAEEKVQAYVSLSPGMEVEKEAILMRKDLTVPGISETSKWEEDIYEIQTTDIVFGGPDGISNRQGKQLANRTCFLKNKQENHDQAENPHSQYLLKTESVLQQQQLSGEMQHLFEDSLEDHTHSEDPHPQYISLPKDTADGMAVVFREGKGWGAEFISGKKLGELVFLPYDADDTTEGLFQISYHQNTPLALDAFPGSNVAKLSCPAEYNADADYFYRCDNEDGTGRNPNGKILMLPAAAKYFFRAHDPDGDVDQYKYQGDAIRNITGSIYRATNSAAWIGEVGGAFTRRDYSGTGTTSNHTSQNYSGFDFDASLVVPTANENRPINISAFRVFIKIYDSATVPVNMDVAALVASQNRANGLMLRRSEAFGIDQTWADVTTQRALNTPYIAHRATSISVGGRIAVAAGISYFVAVIGGSTINGTASYGHDSKFGLSVAIPAGSTYTLSIKTVAGSYDSVTWHEMEV